MNSGIYLHAPEHGRNMWCGMKINIFHQVDEKPAPESMGSIFPIVPPLKVNVKNKGEWNTFRIVMDWPRLRVWTNGEPIQDLDVETVPELRHRLRSGYLGLESLSYPIRFRNLRVRELPSKVHVDPALHRSRRISRSGTSRTASRNSRRSARCCTATGSAISRRTRSIATSNCRCTCGTPGITTAACCSAARARGIAGKHYEIQLHDVEGAHYPTGSLYSVKRGIYPRIEAGQWWLFQLRVKDATCLVRINGETIVEYDKLDNLDEGPIELQAHERGSGRSTRRCWCGGSESRPGVARTGAPGRRSG